MFLAHLRTTQQLWAILLLWLLLYLYYYYYYCFCCCCYSCDWKKMFCSIEGWWQLRKMMFELYNYYSLVRRHKSHWSLKLVKQHIYLANKEVKVQKGWDLTRVRVSIYCLAQEGTFRNLCMLTYEINCPAIGCTEAETVWLGNLHLPSHLNDTMVLWKA